MDLQKYNQRLLAIIGTMVMVAFGGLILIGGVVLIIEVVNDISRRNVQDNSLTIDKMENNDKEYEAFRDQEITFESPILIDTLKTTYLIPVSRVNLKELERISKSRDLLDSYESTKYGNNYRYSGSYNNFIVYNQNKGTKDFVFHQKVDIRSFQHHIIKGENYILMYGANKDSNGDKKLNYDDLKSFFVYDLLTKELKELSFSGMGFSNYYITNDSYEIILEFAKDKNKDGEIDEYQEPTYLKSLSLDTYQITDLVDPGMVKEIQGLID